MKKLLFSVALLPFLAQAQTPLYTAPIGYNAGAPTATPSREGTRIRFDTATNRQYVWNWATGDWYIQGQGIDVVSGSIPPAYTPVKGQSNFAINAADSLYRYYSGAWHLIPTVGPTGPAGSVAAPLYEVIRGTGPSSTSEPTFVSNGTQVVIGNAGSAAAGILRIGDGSAVGKYGDFVFNVTSGSNYRALHHLTDTGYYLNINSDARPFKITGEGGKNRLTLDNYGRVRLGYPGGFPNIQLESSISPKRWTIMTGVTTPPGGSYRRDESLSIGINTEEAPGYSSGHNSMKLEFETNYYDSTGNFRYDEWYMQGRIAETGKHWRNFQGNYSYLPTAGLFNAFNGDFKLFPTHFLEDAQPLVSFQVEESGHGLFGGDPAYNTSRLEVFSNSAYPTAQLGSAEVYPSLGFYYITEAHDRPVYARIEMQPTGASPGLETAWLNLYTRDTTERLAASWRNGQLFLPRTPTKTSQQNVIFEEDGGLYRGRLLPSNIGAEGAEIGDVIKWNGSVWAPDSDAGAAYTAGDGIDITDFVITNTGDPDPSDDITGSLTIGYVPVALTSHSLDDSPITANTATGKIGINALPTTKHAVTIGGTPGAGSGINALGAVFGAQSGSGYPGGGAYNIYPTDTTGRYRRIFADVALRTGFDEGSFFFQTAGDSAANTVANFLTRFYIGNNGRVAVGTTTPADRFTVLGDVYFSARMRDGDGLFGSSGQVYTNVGSYNKWLAPADGSTTNEIQRFDTATIVSNVLRLSLLNDNVPFSGINLSAYLDNTDSQTLDTFTIVSNVLRASVSGDGVPFKSVNLAPYLDDQTVTITNGGGVAVSGTYPNFTLTATDQSTTNEIQDLSISGNILSLTSDGTTVDLTTAIAAGNYWSKTGSDLYYTAGKVGVGVTPSYLMHVKGASATAATTSLRVDDSGNTALFLVNNGGQTGVGKDLSLATNVGYSTIVPDAGDLGGTITVTNTSGGDNTNSVSLLNGALEYAGTNGFTVGRALQFIAFNSNTATTNVIQGIYGAARSGSTSSRGASYTGFFADSYTNQTGGTVGSVAGFNANFWGTTGAGSTITAAYGLKINDVLNSGTITNTYGVHVGVLTTGTQTNVPYSFISTDPSARQGFSGKTQIGGTGTPARTLDVVGELRVSDLTTDTPTRIIGADADGDAGSIGFGSQFSLDGSNNLVYTPATTYYQTLRVNGTGATQRAATNFITSGQIVPAFTDDSGGGETEMRFTIVPASITTTDLNATGVSFGSYTNANITVGTDGRIISASNGSAGGSTALSALTDATATNTINNANHTQTWNWDTADNETGMVWTANALTTGGFIQMSTSNNSLNSIDGIFTVKNNGTSTSGNVFTVAANSTSNRGLWVRANARVGINTPTPISPLNVAGVGYFGTSRLPSIESTLVGGVDSSDFRYSTSIENRMNTSGGHATLYAKVGGTSGGDPAVVLEVPSGGTWSMGIDNSVTNDPLRFSASSTVGTTSVLEMLSSGVSAVVLDRTITGAGTTGAQTINKMAGTVNFAASASTLVVTNSLVTTSSIVLCVVRTGDTTATIKNVIPASGSFTITLGAAATAETSVGFVVFN